MQLNTLQFLSTLSRMKIDGEYYDSDGNLTDETEAATWGIEPYIQENDDAVETLANLIRQARELTSPAVEELPTFTIFCQQSDGRGTIHIASLEAADLESAIAAGITTCAEDWDEENPANIHCLGVAQGDVEILHWEDIEA